jgi:lipid-A-disaccharide synthase
MARVAAAIAREVPSARFAMALAEPRLAERARDGLAAHDPNHRIEVREGPFDSWLSSASLAIAKSGTVTLDIARRGVPLVIVYRLERAFDRAGSRLFLSVPNISLLNLLAAREIVPEILYVGDDEEPKITEPALALLRDGAARRAQLESLAKIRPLFDAPGASARAAEAVLEIAERRRSQLPRATSSTSAPPPNSP